jgi:hypothetical protein
MDEPKKRFLLRIDPHVYDALEHWSADELRSVNAQIELVLTDALRRAGRLKSRGTEAIRNNTMSIHERRPIRKLAKGSSR